MMIVSAAALFFAFAPFEQVYLSWVALVPWLLCVARARSWCDAFFWSWGAGTAFALACIWWLFPVTVPGTLGLSAYCGAFWGLAALALRASRALHVDAGSAKRIRPIAAMLLIACFWTTSEWVRGTFLTGFPWAFLGYAQTPLLAMCQIADLTGVYGVTFWAACANALLALLALRRFRIADVAPAAGLFALLTMGLAGYGVWRLSQPVGPAGPTVMVVQSNFPQDNSGLKGASLEELLGFHLRTTRAGLAEARSRGEQVDLVAWSETMMPALGSAAREATRGSPYGKLAQAAHDAIGALAREYETAFLTGGEHFAALRFDSDAVMPVGRRNAAFFYGRDGRLSDLRYDKVHLVPFGELLPFRESVPWLHALLRRFGPRDWEYSVEAGMADALTVFPLDGGARFVTPICFEDSDPALVARMFRPERSGGGRKRADLIVNITNDGWFLWPQLSQHLQIARFRSIENRVPSARSVNTGISAFIDSAGRVMRRAPIEAEATITQRVVLDGRITLYTGVGDVFAIGCAMVTLLAAIILPLVSWLRSRPARSMVDEEIKSYELHA